MPSEKRKGQIAGHILKRQSAALLELARSSEAQVVAFSSFLATVRGRIVFTGMGKSGHVARLLSATFSSVGLPALFLHPSEALHGDIGGVVAEDVLVCISKSGYGLELAAVVERVTVPTALLTCGDGPLTQAVDCVIHLPLSSEAGPYGLVPSSSILVTLAFGQAVALERAVERGFSPTQFGRVHPAGSLGKQLQPKDKE